ncbi:hypothetical protein LTR17_006101 [Elasticomyces elasticus]|nr:hypothetical protein LTR17_006101 [Elasticomyces elasticus]
MTSNNEQRDEADYENKRWLTCGFVRAGKLRSDTIEDLGSEKEDADLFEIVKVDVLVKVFCTNGCNKVAYKFGDLNGAKKEKMPDYPFGVGMLENKPSLPSFCWAGRYANAVQGPGHGGCDTQGVRMDRMVAKYTEEYGPEEGWDKSPYPKGVVGPPPAPVVPVAAGTDAAVPITTD